MHWARRGVFLLCLAVGGLSLSSCETAVNSIGASLVSTDALGIFREEEVNMTQRNYAAADYLIQQARSYITRHDLIKATTLIDKEEPRVYSSIGRSIPEQVGIRLSQLGYKLDLSEVVDEADDPNYFKPEAKVGGTPAFILSGTYIRRPQELDISLRLSDAGTGRVVAVFDYLMPMNRDISDMSEPEARIFKTEE